MENVFVDIKDGEERSQVNCQNSNPANEARDRAPIAQHHVKWARASRGRKVTSSEKGTLGPGTGLSGYLRVNNRDQP